MRFLSCLGFTAAVSLAMPVLGSEFDSNAFLSFRQSAPDATTSKFFDVGFDNILTRISYPIFYGAANSDLNIPKNYKAYAFVYLDDPDDRPRLDDPCTFTVSPPDAPGLNSTISVVSNQIAVMNITISNTDPSDPAITDKVVQGTCGFK
ncbi:hypothetical protein DM01DRAFT_333968 [Hesseltinella vesiculosa]|uniref:Ubiquitin 3 binding protein But2 C-terminal domain-containing protein n=1 Tax=Hesseltinella vesiculosa TaxID=101127 RepID=A0A1X2GV02_9FUNG|nr:hypothetical protein DM01DRAFT_333968 [Hesseltinella vesiculosa]